MDNETKILAWHIAPGNMMLNPEHNGDAREIVIGETLSVGGDIRCCHSGLHASVRAVDALRNRPRLNELVCCRVEVWGDVDTKDEKIAGRYRRVLWVVPPDKFLRVLVTWAMECARGALESERSAGREPDARSWAALDACQRWFDGTITREELRAAADAAYAAYAAAYAAYAAADAAADAAARAACDAYAAAYAAARAACAAADAAADAAARAACDATYAARAAARAESNARLEALLEAHAVYAMEGES